MKLIKYLKLVILFLLFNLAGMTAVQAETLHHELAESSRSIMRVGPNQSLDLLVQQIYPNQQQLWPEIKQKIKELNPHSFNRYTGRLIPGQRLKLVTIKTIREGETSLLVQAGTVKNIKGYATSTDKTGRESRLQQGTIVYEGDRVSTAQGGELVIHMIDDAEMRIKPDSSVRITEYKMKSGFESGSRSIIDLIKGGLRKITGSIGANPLSVYRFQTGIMTIGVRGTDYVVKLCNANDCEQSSGRNEENARLHVAVLDGLITLEDEEGVQGELALGQYAIATQDTKVIVNDAKPVKGLLNAEEQAIFDKLQPPSEKSSLIWPWLLGGALLGL
jgi:hypothetical protein